MVCQHASDHIGGGEEIEPGWAVWIVVARLVRVVVGQIIRGSHVHVIDRGAERKEGEMSVVKRRQIGIPFSS
jgi:hypothetical protein